MQVRSFKTRVDLLRIVIELPVTQAGKIFDKDVSAAQEHKDKFFTQIEDSLKTIHNDNIIRTEGLSTI